MVVFRILVVEDDATMRAALAQALKVGGYEVESAESGVKALEKAASHPFDLILSDIRMPGMDGVATISRAKEAFPRVKTILITGYSDDEPLIRALNLGADGILKKPFAMRDLLNLVSVKLEDLEREREAETSRRALEQRMRTVRERLRELFGEHEASALLGEESSKSTPRTGVEASRLATLGELGRMAEMRQEADAAIQAYEEILGLLSGGAPSPDEFQARLALSNLFFRKGKRELAFEHAEEALTLARALKDPDLTVDAHHHLAALWMEVLPEKSRAHLEEGQRFLGKDSGFKERQAASLLLRASWMFQQGDQTNALAQIKEFLRHGKRHFLPRILAWLQNFALTPFFLAFTENEHHESACWILEEASPFLQENLRRLASRKPEWSEAISRFLFPHAHNQPYKLQVQTFGKLAFLLDGKALVESHWKSMKGLSLFLYLLYHHPKLVSEEHLLDSFWPHLHPDRARHTFRTTLYLVRRAIGHGKDQPLLRQEKQKFGIHPAASIWCDFLHFKNLMNQARSDWGKGERNRAVFALREAEKHYRGAFLQGWSDEWCLNAREKFAEDYAWALLALALFHRDQQNWEAALSYARKALTEDPVLEEAHALVMESLLSLGKRDEAVRQYHLCREALNRELSVEPSDPVHQLYLKAVDARPVR